MDDALSAVLAALEGIDAPDASERLDALAALTVTLPRLAPLSPDEWHAKLASARDDLEQLREAAEISVARFDQARRAFETLTLLAERHGAMAIEGPAQLLLAEAWNVEYQPELEERFAELVAQADTTRDAIVAVMARRPAQAWTIGSVTADLARYGRPVTRSNVQVTLRRLADDGRVRKLDRGFYQILREALTGPPGREIPDQQAESERKRRRRTEGAIKAAATKMRQREETIRIANAN